MVHDPLGVELLLNGTIRNQPVLFEEDRREVGGISVVGQPLRRAAAGICRGEQRQEHPQIGVVVLAPLR